MRAVVRELRSPDVEFDEHVPDDPEDVGVLVQIMAGPVSGPGEESFDVMVCTPRWLERRVRETGPVIGRHHLVVESWDAGGIRRYLTGAVESVEGDTWTELAEKIGRVGMWEFEDYRP